MSTSKDKQPDPSKKSFTDIFIKHPVLAIVVNLVLVLAGWRSISNLPVQQYPSIENSSIKIMTIYTGASAETIRGFITTPIERSVSAVSGIDYIESKSYAGVSDITVRLKLNHDTTAALAEISARLQEVRSDLPAEAQPPSIEVQRADSPFASFYISFTSDKRSIPEITDWLTRTMQPELGTLKGVQRISVEGGQSLAMRVWVDPDRLSALNLSPGEVHQAIKRNNYLAAVGQAKNEYIRINLLANTDLRSVEEFEDLIVTQRDGAIVRLKDVADVELGSEEAGMIAKYSDKESVYLGVWPQPGANEIAVATTLRAEIERLRKTLPSDIEMELAYDGTEFIENALYEISITLIETILIVGFVVYLFLGSVRAAMIPLVAMPVSLLGAVAFMLLLGFSLNLLTILAIVLSVGLVVDDAIVVVENVARHVREGMTRTNAAITGARELVSPVIAMTITLAAVYAPIGFQGGLTGMLFFEFAITLAVAVMVSGFVAVTLSPMMSSYLISENGKESWLTKVVNRIFIKVCAAYHYMLEGALKIRWAFVVVALLIMAAAWPLYEHSRRELAPVEDQSSVMVIFDVSPDASLESVNRESYKVIESLTQIPEAKFMWSLVSSTGGFGGLVVKDWDERDRSTKEILGEVYGRAAQIPGLNVIAMLRPPLPSPGNFDVDLVLQSDMPLNQMSEMAQNVINAGFASGKFMYVDTDFKLDLPEARVIISREKIADLGLSLAAVGQELGALLGGGYVNRFNYFERSYKVIPQIGSEKRKSIGPLLDLKIKTPSGELVPISTFARFEASTAPRTLTRFQQRNAIRIFGVVNPGVTKAEGLAVLEAALEGKGDGRIAVDYLGESRQLRKESSSLTTSLGFAIVLIYLVLSAQFKSFRDPLIVLLGSVPLAISGALIFSYLDFTTLNIYSQVGLITLVGLIAKNGILIVEFANTLQENGVSKISAIREASTTRLRPILMTTASTVLGHAPLVFVTGPGAEARNSIGIVLVTGMLVGTLFTLFIVPVYYSLIAKDRGGIIDESNAPAL